MSAVHDPQDDGAAFGRHLKELLEAAQETARGMAEAEEALRLVRDRFEHTKDPEMQGELAAEALDQVDRQMQLLRERRRQLDSAEGTLWGRRNRLEQFLISTRGADWWRARRDRERAQAAGGACQPAGDEPSPSAGSS